MLKNFAVVFLVLTTSLTVLAQASENSGLQNFWQDVNGNPLKINSTIKVEGSQYYSDDYRISDVVLFNGKKYENINCKINLATNEVIFLNDKGENIVVSTPIQKIHIYESIKDGKHLKSAIIKALNNEPVNNEKSKIVEIIDDGDSVKLYRSYVVTHIDTKGYGEATTTRTYKINPIYYGVIVNQPHRAVIINKNKKSVENFFQDFKSLQITGFINKYKLTCKNEADIIKIFGYANTP